MSSACRTPSPPFPTAPPEGLRVRATTPTHTPGGDAHMGTMLMMAPNPVPDPECRAREMNGGGRKKEILWVKFMTW